MNSGLNAGAVAEYRRVLLQSDFDRFAKLTGDDNPIHCDPAFAAKSHFGATVAHGMMLYSCICKGLAELIPGPGAVQLEQSLMFPNPTFVNDQISVRLTVEGAAAGVLDIATDVCKPGPGGKLLPTATGRTRVVPAGVAVPAMAPFAAGGESGDTALYGLRPGATAAGERVFSAADLDEYGDLTGDRNPVFRDDGAARARGFAGRIVPWPLLAGMFSDLLGTRLPGRGTGWMKQTLRYPAPAYPGETLSATVAITRLRADKELVNLSTRVLAADQRVVCDGEALVLVRNLENKTG
ncbi:MAG: MaoC/PaaZ C-terminal domain-containing protein [Proteobacteria bacterium]|nr:MaoC/PaaZ C-terminal domain-containing protein [Pseudomonadota bacterium]